MTVNEKTIDEYKVASFRCSICHKELEVSLKNVIKYGSEPKP